MALAAVGLGLLIGACDKVNIDEVNQSASVKSNQKVLIEDFTGHKCVNCPQAHELLHKLIETYSDTNIFAVAVHAGFFATVSPNPPYQYDFRTPAGNEYVTTFEPNSFPIGMVNRKAINNSVLLDKDAWGSVAADLFKNTSPMNIEVISDYTSGNTLSGKVNISFIAPMNTKAKLQIIVTEDNIIKPQLTPEGVKEDYNHMHVLRGAVNGIWGQDLPQDSYAANETASIDFSGYTMGEDWKAKDLRIIAYVYNAASKEIMQVNGVKVLK